ncbi:MAG: hypothetical protein MRY83_17595 [Flavobacteriales bacterium]|nr:hypothetical protein [Flavobacteriales bacterium]
MKYLLILALVLAFQNQETQSNLVMKSQMSILSTVEANHINSFKEIIENRMKGHFYKRLDSLKNAGYQYVFIREEFDSNRNISTVERYFDTTNAEACWICYDENTVNYFPNLTYENGVYINTGHPDYASQDGFLCVLNQIIEHFDTLEVNEIARKEIWGSVCNSCSWGWTSISIQKEIKKLSAKLAYAESKKYQIETFLSPTGIQSSFQIPGKAKPVFLFTSGGC